MYFNSKIMDRYMNASEMERFIKTYQEHTYNNGRIGGKVTDKDIALLKEYRNSNPKPTLKSLGQKFGLNPSSVLNRLRRAALHEVINS